MGREESKMGRIAIWLLCCILAVVGLVQLTGGAILIIEGGSPYYIAAAGAVLASAFALVRRSRYAVIIYAGVLVATLLWSLWEVGLDGWALIPPLLAPALVGLLFLLPAVRERSQQPARWWIAVPVAANLAAIVLSGVLAMIPDDDLSPATVAKTAGPAGPTEWKHWGNTLDGQRYVTASQINTHNVHHLELAWRFDSGLKPHDLPSFEATPLAADGRLYVCLQPGIVAAIDQDTGEQIWRFTTPSYGKVDFSRIFGGKCRGVSYYESSQSPAQCQKRILFSTPDGYLMAVDAADGQPCQSFGESGAVDLQEGMWRETPTARTTAVAMPSSPPTIVNGVAVVGQTVSDLESLDAPSGVIRGYDAETGALRWAWDAGRPDQTLLQPGEFYTRDTPNAWTPFSGDDELGLVFVPTGNGPPDYYGGSRSETSERFGASVVAIDVATGKVRWSFQTVHHDLWDYDLASQPVAVDLSVPEGVTQALLVPTKLGQIFVLDRRNGTPIDPVVERPVPQDAVPGERPSPTQPYTNGFPSLSGADLRENDMWGITPLDQLWCRIKFKRAHYEGQFTPLATRDTIMYPGTAGGINWGSVSVDGQRGLISVNTLRVANFGRLIPRAKVPSGEFGGREWKLIIEQAGTPYAFTQAPFMSPLGVPCQRPPYGTIHVLDLQTRELVWSKSLGTAARSGPFGLPSLLPIRMGVPNMGGAVVTAGGLVFIGAAQDRRLRAYDIGNGRELWRAQLPAVGAATPMTYVSPKTGRQYVVIASGGHYGIYGPSAGALLAFALP